MKEEGIGDIREKLPRIVSPNLGCPLFLPADNLQDAQAYLVLADRKDNAAWSGYRLRAEPSFEGEGKEFTLQLEEHRQLHDDALPEKFDDVAETRFLISTTLRTNVFKGQAQFRSFRLKVEAGVGWDHLRQVKGQPRSTLYDLVLLRGQQEASRVKHALCLRVPSREVRFVHLSDLHVAARNDMWDKEVNSIVSPTPGTSSLRFINFNDRLRKFIEHANELANKGELDFVLAMGDLVDFVQLGLGEPHPGENNWHVIEDILVGDKGLRAPIFTTTGNHDWRRYPYPPEFNAWLFGLTKKQAEKLDYLYHDSSKLIGEKIQDVHSKLIAEGSPILARSWWRSPVGFGLRRLELAMQRISTWFAAFEGKLLKRLIPVFVAAFLGHGEMVDRKIFFENKLWWNYLPGLEVLLVFSLLAYLVWEFAIRNWIGDLLRRKITSLLGIETSVDSLGDYFLLFNPYFNYAFQLENCYFLVADTGHDCLTAQSFWDDGGKKLRPISVRDNIIGGSPDTMGFFPPNQYFHYSQIAWLEMVLELIQEEHKHEANQPRKCRVFVGLHTPPANLSKKARRRADGKLKQAQDGQILMPRRSRLFGGFDIRYGSVNHYLSEFFYLCLGYTQANPKEFKGPGIDAVFAGHAHWSIEFKLNRPKGDSWKPEVYYGSFSGQVEKGTGRPDRWWGPLLLQTAACGPRSKTDEYSPNYRYVTVNENLGVENLSQRDARAL